MIRLSEALARLHCEKEIKVKYVDEAKRLLKMSIISVKSSDVSLDDYEEDDGLAGGGGGGGGGGDDDDDQGGGDAGDDAGEAGEAGDGGAAEKDTEKEVEETPTRRRKRAREERASPQKSPAKSPAKGAAAAAVAEAASAAPAKKRKLEMKQEEFDLISIRVMGLLSAREERGEEEYEQADLVNTYLDQVCVCVVFGWVGVRVCACARVFCDRRVCVL